MVNVARRQVRLNPAVKRINRPPVQPTVQLFHPKPFPANPRGRRSRHHPPRKGSHAIRWKLVNLPPGIGSVHGTQLPQAMHLPGEIEGVEPAEATDVYNQTVFTPVFSELTRDCLSNKASTVPKINIYDTCATRTATASDISIIPLTVMIT